jgi:hypothetical protein
LVECIRSLVEGVQRPQEIIVVGRNGDSLTEDAFAETQTLCAGRTTLRAGWVKEAGHLPPVEKGLALASGAIIAIVDDDVTVTADWLGYLLGPFTDPSVGVVGGRVIMPGGHPPQLKGRPGCNSWYGKHWGNVSSLQGDSPIEVQSVMECNWAWRRDLLVLLKFDPILNFDDASMYGLDLCLQAASMGFRVVYEPRALVFHHVAPRVPSLDRADRPKRAFSYARNYTYIMLKHLSWWKRPIFLLWWVLIGERGSWGLAAVLADTLAAQLPRPSDVWGAFTGKIAGIVLSVSGASAHGS